LYNKLLSNFCINSNTINIRKYVFCVFCQTGTKCVTVQNPVELYTGLCATEKI
jgi:hypothetical protein